MESKRLGIVLVLALGLLSASLVDGLLEVTAADLTSPSETTPTGIMADSPISPTTPVKLIFIHHSCGGNWLADTTEHDMAGGLGQALMENNYFVSATNYGWGPDSIGNNTNVPDWPRWFTDTMMAAVYAETGQNICAEEMCFGNWTRMADPNPTAENEVVMFKSCFPNSDIYGNPDDPPSDTPNDEFTVANFKAVYNTLLTYFAAHQDKLFIVITAPPLSEVGYVANGADPPAADRAANARAFNNWLVNDWLEGYAHNNVAVFDFYNVLTSNGSAGRVDDTGLNTEPNDYAARPDGNHHYWDGSAIVHPQTINNNFAAYPYYSQPPANPDPWSDDHPMAAGNQKATAEFVPLLNVYYNRWKGGGGPTCIGVTDVGIGGPTGGYTGTTYSFTAHVTPTGATAPFTYTWAPAPTSGQGALSAQYTWPVTGAKTITLTVANCGGSDAATHVITIDPRPVARIAIYLPLVLRNYTSTPPTCPVPLTGVAISGPVSGVTNTTYVFTATPIPVNATQPVAYTWSPDPESGQGTVSARYRWETAGSKSLYVAAGNCGGGTNTATAHHTITLQGASPGDLIYPADFTYLGAFRLPDEASGDISWSYGGIGMTYYPHGDPASTDDYPGSLFSISDYPFNNYVSEFSIPVPVVSAHKNLADLPMATTLQPFADITNGRQEPGLTGLAVVDVQYYPQQGAQTSDKLYWVMFEYYMPEDEFGHGWSELTLSAPQAQGAWRLGDFPTAGVNKYLFEIPTAWADAYTPGLYLAAGRARIPNNGSWGPALHAFGPWNDGNPPASGSSVAATQMVYYAYDYDNYISDHMARDYSHADEWQDGAWLTVGDRSAVMLAGVKGLRREYELEYYGDDNVDACGNSKGWHAEPYYAAVLFYDPALLAASVQGEIEPYEIQPYAMLNLEDYMFQQGCRRQTLGGVGYDRERRLVYVLEREVLADGGKPIVHVFQLSATAHSADLTPPTAPTNVQATPTAAQVALTWNAASDNAHLAGYILYRFGEPIATTPATTYTDDKVNPGATYTYTVVAWDASNNLSAPAAVVATTPAGADERVPVIYAIKYSGLDDTGLTVRWQTDEPATTVLTYEVAYSGDMQVYQNATLTRRHEVVLTDLTPETNYFVWAVVGADAAGHTNIFHLENWDFYTAPTGETRNFRPVLNGIGSRRVMLGETVAFTLEALDRDSDDTLTFSAVDLPAGATLHPTTGQFSWTPSTAGTTRITFSVSDGDQVDSERVTIFVAASSR